MLAVWANRDGAEEIRRMVRSTAADGTRHLDIWWPLLSDPAARAAARSGLAGVANLDHTDSQERNSLLVVGGCCAQNNRFSNTSVALNFSFMSNASGTTYDNVWAATAEDSAVQQALAMLEQTIEQTSANAAREQHAKRRTSGAKSVSSKHDELAMKSHDLQALWATVYYVLMAPPATMDLDGPDGSALEESLMGTVSDMAALDWIERVSHKHDAEEEVASKPFPFVAGMIVDLVTTLVDAGLVCVEQPMASPQRRRDAPKPKLIPTAATAVTRLSVLVQILWSRCRAQRVDDEVAMRMSQRKPKYKVEHQVCVDGCRPVAVPGMVSVGLRDACKHWARQTRMRCDGLFDAVQVTKASRRRNDAAMARRAVRAEHERGTRMNGEAPPVANDVDFLAPEEILKPKPRQYYERLASGNGTATGERRNAPIRLASDDDFVHERKVDVRKIVRERRVRAEIAQHPIDETRAMSPSSCASPAIFTSAVVQSHTVFTLADSSVGAMPRAPSPNAVVATVVALGNGAAEDEKAAAPPLSSLNPFKCGSGALGRFRQFVFLSERDKHKGLPELQRLRRIEVRKTAGQNRW
jgi:hypothetical protein